MINACHYYYIFVRYYIFYIKFSLIKGFNNVDEIFILSHSSVASIQRRNYILEIGINTRTHSIGWHYRSCDTPSSTLM